MRAAEEAGRSLLAPDEILRVEDLRVWFPLRRGLGDIVRGRPRRYVKAVDGVSFSIRRKEVLCLVGESGCGKTTTGKAIMRLVPIMGGHIYFRPTKSVLEDLWGYGAEVLDGEVVDIASLPDAAVKPLRRSVQMIYQDPYGSLNPRYTIEQTLEEPLIIHGLGLTREERVELVAKTLEAVRLVPPENFMWRYPHQLSGGQRQRVAIARAMILNPELIVADEPVSMLDVSIRAEILELLIDIKERLGVSYLFITHDLAVARYICDRIAIMYLGKIVEMGDALRVIENPLHPYTKALIAAIPEPNPENRKRIRDLKIKGEVPSAANIPPGCRFHPRCVVFDERRRELEAYCPAREPPLVEAEKGHYVACWLYARR
ncbi:ABC transporter ATP-binding protein [Stetteria hydrogenophila]